VSIPREVWRLVWRALAAAGPTSWKYASVVWGAHTGFYRRVTTPFRRQPWLAWLLWLMVGAAVGISLYTFSVEAPLLPVIGPALHTGGNLAQIILRAVILPPLLLFTLWPAVVALSLGVAGCVGAALGAYRSFSR
jgi:hypothetical protein